VKKHFRIKIPANPADLTVLYNDKEGTFYTFSDGVWTEGYLGDLMDENDQEIENINKDVTK